ncbi:MAG: O-antigen ligase family protein [Polaribacter sp.]|uniref:O-antigen ligase family protein n=1 Tax=Polaribacter sp. TaxID=1920175 RepID=UPI002F3517C9
MNVLLNNISKISLTLVLITLPLGFAVNSISIILFFLVGCFKLIQLKERVVFNKLMALFIGFYILCFLSLFWSDNVKSTTEGLPRFLPYIILPIAFLLNNIRVDKREEVLNFFSKSLVYYAFYCLLIGALNTYKYSDFSYLFYHKLSNNLSNMNAIYLSVFISFGIGFFLTKKGKTKLDSFSLFFLALFLILLSSKIIITFTLLFTLVFFLKRKNTKKLNYKYSIIIFGVTLILLLASNNVIKRIKKEIDKTNISEALNKNEFGNVYLWTGASLRIFQIRAFYEIITEQQKYYLGFGLNNSQNSLNKKYSEYKLYPGYLSYNYHNQYIQVFAELGVLGFILLLMIFYTLIKQSILYKDFSLFYMIMLIMVVCFTESFLWRQRGMVFFITIALLSLKKNNN